MKRSLFILLLLAGLKSYSQPFNNEWIDYSKTYYKFKVGANGLYRITQPALTGLSLQNIPAEQFQLWRNGEQVPLYTSVATGALGAGDYIEFWGEMNDGKPDNIMYRDADFQLNDKWSLQTDTAAYFLTVNPTGNNLRFITTANTPGGTPEPFFMHVAGKYWKDRIGQGYAQVVGENVFSSAYDAGEGWASGDINKGEANRLIMSLSTAFPYTGAGAPEATLRVHASGYNGVNPRSFRVRVNGDSIIGRQMDFFDYAKVTNTFPVSLIAGGTANIDITNQSQVAGSDRMLASMLEITYPRLFNFENQTSFRFSLPANIAGNYLEINSFNYGAVAPVLYDLTNHQRYVADVTSTPGTVKVRLQPSATDRKLILVSQAAGIYTSVTNFQQRNFIDYSTASLQGNYLVITHPNLLNGSNGSHPIDDYMAYRNSATGGSYNAKSYMIDQLVDQFAFGIKRHPLSVRNFIRFARARFNQPVKYVLLVGKGVQYIQHRLNESNADMDKLALIPTFGHPASDWLMAAEPGLDEIPKVAIGRLSVVAGDEVTVYLNKVKEYEQAQVFQSPLIADKAWMKNVAHVIGASEEGLNRAIEAAMGRFDTLLSDTAFGGDVHLFNKSNTESVEQANNTRLQNLFNQGLSIVTYFGHSSATTLEYNLDNPQHYNNQGKYPLFILLGCNAGNFFNFNLARLYTKETISEKYVLADQRGSIASIASTHLGIVHYLDIYNTKNYFSLGYTKYNHTLGEAMIEAITQVYNTTTQNDYYARFHCEQATLHGDPALKLNAHAKPDYAIEQPMIKIEPFVSVADQFVRLDAKFMNIGKAVSDSITIEIKRKYPDGQEAVIHRRRIPGIRYADSMYFNVPIIESRDKGQNSITVTVDADNDVDELYETDVNNRVTANFFVYEDEARAIFPYNYSIVNSQNIRYIASTANPFSPTQQYNMEIDTTELFNSPLKVATNVVSPGGIMQFTPGITLRDSTVYYWRVAPNPTSGAPTWNTSSFIYLPNSDGGFNQSHYYQHTRSKNERMTYDSDGQWRYDSLPHFLFAKNGVFLTATSQEGDIIVSPDGDPYIRSACVGNSLIFNVFSHYTFRPMVNDPARYGSAVSCQPSRTWNFEFDYTLPANRKKAMDFLDSIPNGSFVVVRNILNNFSTTGLINEWIADQALYGTGNTLYHRLKALGFNALDSFTSPRALIFIYQKGNAGFGPVSIASQGMYDVISLDKSMKTPDTLGYITSPLMGMAANWKTLYWKGSAAPGDPILRDAPTVDVIGVKFDGTEDIQVDDLTLNDQEVDISGIDAHEYPYIKLRMRNVDTTYFSPYQLKYWRVTYDPVPEGALAPNVPGGFATRDTVDVGEPFDFKIAFYNVTNAAFDSMKVKVQVTDRNNISTIIPMPRRRELMANPDSLHVGGTIPTQNFPGMNRLLVEVNPDNDQPEQYHHNNFVYRNFYVRPDTLNPMLDVTFDGTHILNRDIVASRPEILIKLRDEAKWMLLDTNRLASVSVRFPDGSVRQYAFNNDTLQFFSAGQV
ncbi:MAG TPA: C25 family cysteine peptidase, partial [Chitinophagaceae bacterium]|nr:C25 family cysteine peptidase [Chitinophagaceae bacterium]